VSPTRKGILVSPTPKGILIMEFVLNNQDLVEHIASNLDFPSLSKLRLASKNMNKFTKKYYIRTISKYSKFELKKCVAAGQIYGWMIENEMDFIADNIDQPVNFETFYNEVHNNDILYNLLIINCDSQNELDEKVHKLYDDFIEDFIDGDD